MRRQRSAVVEIIVRFVGPIAKHHQDRSGHVVALARKQGRRYMQPLSGREIDAALRASVEGSHMHGSDRADQKLLTGLVGMGASDLPGRNIKYPEEALHLE